MNPPDEYFHFSCLCDFSCVLLVLQTGQTYDHKCYKYRAFHQYEFECELLDLGSQQIFSRSKYTCGYVPLYVTLNEPLGGLM